MAKFEQCKKYTGRFISDSDATYCFEVVKRTAKRLTIKDVHTEEVKTVGITADHTGDEMAYPFGKYSMAPTIRASRVQEA